MHANFLLPLLPSFQPGGALWRFLKLRNYCFATSKTLVCFYAYFCYEIKRLRKCFGRAYSSVTPEPITYAPHLGSQVAVIEPPAPWLQGGEDAFRGTDAAPMVGGSTVLTKYICTRRIFHFLNAAMRTGRLMQGSAGSLGIILVKEDHMSAWQEAWEWKRKDGVSLWMT